GKFDCLSVIIKTVVSSVFQIFYNSVAFGNKILDIVSFSDFDFISSLQQSFIVLLNGSIRNGILIRVNHRHFSWVYFIVNRTFFSCTIQLMIRRNMCVKVSTVEIKLFQIFLRKSCQCRINKTRWLSLIEKKTFQPKTSSLIFS